MNDKKEEQKCFSLSTKNLNWEVLTKTVVTFKRWDGVNGRKILIRAREGGVTKNQYTNKGELPRREGLGPFADLKGAWRKREGDTPLHTMNYL